MMINGMKRFRTETQQMDKEPNLRRANWAKTEYAKISPGLDLNSNSICTNYIKIINWAKTEYEQ